MTFTLIVEKVLGSLSVGVGIRILKALNFSADNVMTLQHWVPPLRPYSSGFFLAITFLRGIKMHFSKIHCIYRHLKCILRIFCALNKPAFFSTQNVFFALSIMYFLSFLNIFCMHPNILHIFLCIYST